MTQSNKDKFDQDGFLKIDPLFDKETMREINCILDEFLIDGITNMPADRVYYENKADKTSIKQLLMLYEYSPYFREMMFNGPIRRIAEEVLGDEVVPQNMQYFNKPAGVGEPTPPHQDGYYFHLTPSEAVTGWLALEEVDEENGCIHYVKGSHKSIEFREHGFTNVLGFSQGMMDFGTKDDIANTVSCPGDAGTFLIHHARTIHWAEANRSTTRSRRALGFIYYAKSAKLDLSAKESYQKKLNARLREEGKI